MKIRYSSHGAYNHLFHIVWIPKYRKKVLKGKLKEYLKEKIFEIEEYYKDIKIEKHNVQEDHVHIVIIISPKYSVSEIVGKIKSNTSRDIRKNFEWIKKIYWKGVFWSPGFFSSTVGIDEEIIKNYVEFQGKVDNGQMEIDF